MALAVQHSICSVSVQGRNVRNDLRVLCLLGQTQSEREMTVFVLVPKHCKKVLWCGWLTPHSIAHANTVIMPEKLEVSWRPVEDLAPLLPDFEIAVYTYTTHCLPPRPRYTLLPGSHFTIFILLKRNPHTMAS